MQALTGSRTALAPAPLRAQPFAAQQQRAACRGAALRVACSAQEGRSVRERVAAAATAVALTLTLGRGAEARLEGVNKPELLPEGPVTPVLDVAGFLTDGEERRLRAKVQALEADTGVKLRVLAQNYPQTPGLAIKDYWGVDDDTVVFVADPNTGNILNFNVGQNVDLLVPRSFWSRLAGRWGVKFYWQDQGPSASIVNAVTAIDNCLREPQGRNQCSTLRGELD